MMRRYAAVAGLPRRVILPRADAHAAAVQPLGRPGHARARRASPGRWSSPCARGRLRRTRHRRVRPRPARRPRSASTEAVALALRRVRDARRAHPLVLRRVPGRPAATRCPTDPDWAGGSLYTDERELAVDASPAAAVAGGRGHRRRERLVLLPAGLGRARLAGPARRRRRAAPRPARPAPGCGSATPWTSGGSRRSSRAAAAAARRDAGAGPGLAGAARRAGRADGGGTGATAARLFHPHGLAGHALLVGVSPFHAVVFGGMARNIARAAETAERARTVQPRPPDPAQYRPAARRPARSAAGRGARSSCGRCPSGRIDGDDDRPPVQNSSPSSRAEQQALDRGVLRRAGARCGSSSAASSGHRASNASLPLGTRHQPAGAVLPEAGPGESRSAGTRAEQRRRGHRVLRRRQ